MMVQITEHWIHISALPLTSHVTLGWKQSLQASFFLLVKWQQTVYSPSQKGINIK